MFCIIKGSENRRKSPFSRKSRCRSEDTKAFIAAEINKDAETEKNVAIERF